MWQQQLWLYQKPYENSTKLFKIKFVKKLDMEAAILICMGLFVQTIVSLTSSLRGSTP